MSCKKVSMLILIQIISIFLTCGCSQSNKFEIINKNRKVVSVFELKVPEPWFKNKTSTGHTETYTEASGNFLVRKMKSKESLFFKLSDSDNVYSWDNESYNIAEASLLDWNNATREMSLYSYSPSTDDVAELTIDQKKISNFIRENNINPAGQKRFSIRKSLNYYNIISFSGDIKPGNQGLVTGSGESYKGTAYLEVYSKDNKLILLIKNILTKYQSALFYQSFWYDDSTLLVPNEDVSSIIIIKFKN